LPDRTDELPLSVGRGDFMSIARVVHASGFPTGDPPAPPRVNEALDALRAVDGCEGMYAFRNSQSGEGMSVTIWRDAAALESAQDQIDLLRKLAAGNGVSSISAVTYDIVRER
jgi:Antibiotic biosynthesis monooxygenase